MDGRSVPRCRPPRLGHLNDVLTRRRPGGGFGRLVGGRRVSARDSTTQRRAFTSRARTRRLWCGVHLPSVCIWIAHMVVI